MTWELAKELKDAGFPQNETAKVGCSYRGMDDHAHSDECKAQLTFPTLSELIEACGEELDFLSRTGDGGWVAQMSEEAFEKNRHKWPDACVIDCDGNEHGTTPEEAVARLWLALHKK